MDIAKLNIGLRDMADFFANQMKLNLGAKVKKKVYRVSWKNGKPKNVRIKTIRANHTASGSLVNSIKVVKGPSGGWAVNMNAYGKFVNDGRKPDKGIPSLKLNKWIMDKRLKPRNLSSGEFKANTKNSRKAMAFCMNRKIKWFGIEAFPFIEMSRSTTVYKYDEIIAKLAKEDIKNNFGVVLKRRR